jgi:hypothetical protein
MADPKADIILIFGTDEIEFPFGVSVGIQKDFQRMDDGTLISEKHTINIRGAYVVAAEATDPLEKYKTLIQGVQERISTKYRSNHATGRKKSLQTDILKLNVSGADAFNDQYKGATLISASFAEPSDDTGGFQYQEASLSFECYSTGNDISPYTLKSASESFEIKREDDGFFFGNETSKRFEGDGSDKPYFSFTITHTISAQGNVKIKDGLESEAFNEAYKYVISRRKATLYKATDIYDKDMLGQDLLQGVKITNSDAFKIEGGDAAAQTPYNLTNYQEWNVTNTESVDVAGGSYSSTRTYYYSPASYTMEINGTYEKSEEGIDSLKVDGTIAGLMTPSVYEIFHDKFDNAKIGMAQVVGTGNTPTQPFGKGTAIYKFAEKLFTDNAYTPFYNGIYSLDDRPISTSVTENKIAGTIQFSASYKPIPATLLALKKEIPNCISLTINIQEDNPYHSEISNPSYQMKKVIPIMILGRAAGPVVQDMSTTQESYKTVSLEATVDFSERTPDSKCAASGVKLVIDKYAPSRPNTYLMEISDTFDWTNGKLSVNAKWIYTR